MSIAMSAVLQPDEPGGGGADNGAARETAGSDPGGGVAISVGDLALACIVCSYPCDCVTPAGITNDADDTAAIADCA